MLKGVPSAVGFPHCVGVCGRIVLSTKPFPHKCAESGARTRDLPIIDGRLYRCTRPALHSFFSSRTRRRTAYHCIDRRRKESYIDPQTHHTPPSFNINYVIQRNYFKKPYYVFLLLSSDEKNLFYISLLRLSDIVKLFGTADNVCNISVTTSGWNNKLFSIGRLNRCLIITCYLG